MDQTILFVMILGMSVIIYFPRAIPMLFLPTQRISTEVGIWLRFVPVAILAALLFPSIFLVEEQLSLRWDNFFL